MLDKLIEKLNGKHIAILGFGREGISTYKLIRKYLKDQDLTIIDALDVKNQYTEMFVEDQHVHFIWGEHYLDSLPQYDLVIKTPGISLKNIDTENVKITSQIELLLEVAKDRVIGVTGTKGKSTTTSLIYSILKDQGVDVLLAGNIGIPVFSLLETATDQTIFVIEMSSHQLEYLNVSPHIGVVLNLFEDHLDHAGSVKHYHEIKMRMFLNQTKEDIMIYCSDNATLMNMVSQYHFLSMPYTVSLHDLQASIYLDSDDIYYKGKKVFSKNIKRNLLGNHNLENIMVAFLVGQLLGLDQNKMLTTIENFKALSYRLEYIGKIDQVAYYVDTLATIPSATMEAIESIPNVNTLIFGGMDRGISYDGFAEYLEKTEIEHFICMPTTGHMIGKCLPSDRTFYVETLKEACELAKGVTKKGCTCLLSPAAASYEQFKNYAEKGDKFKEYIIGVE